MTRQLFALLALISLTLTSYSAVIKQSKASIRICSFNIQIFGSKKVSDPVVFANIVKIVQEYDITFVMEIRDDSNTALNQLMDALNKNAPNKFGVAVSERLGRSVSKEQYAYIYKAATINLVESYVFNDKKDAFEREPFIAKFSAPKSVVKNFFMLGIHAIPNNIKTSLEIESLIDVYDDASTRFNLKDGLLVGDMNADCGYLNNKQKASNRLRTDTRFVWLINDDVDTTTKDSDCAYDRVIVAGTNMITHANKVEVFNFQKEFGLDQETTEKISDHYPVIITVQ